MGNGTQLILAAADGEDDQPVAPAIDERLDDLMLAIGVTLGAGEEHEVSEAIAGVLDAAGQLARRTGR
jgi:hypothetical protein